MANKSTATKKAPAKSASKNSKTPAKSASKNSKAPAKGGSKTNSKGKAPRAGIEIFGIVLLALGALCAVWLYSGADDALGKIISGYLFGMHGCFAYAVPVLFVIIGIYLIIGGRKKPARSTLTTGLLAVLFILCALHMWTSRDLYTLKQLGVSGMKFADYAKQFFAQFPAAWIEGTHHHIGGGVIGMFLPTLLYVLGGKLLCWVVIIAGFLISVLLCTGISIKAYTDAFGSKVREKLAEREQSLTEGYDDEEEEESEPLKKPWKRDFSTTIDEEPAPARRKPEEHKKPNRIPFDELFDVPASEPAKPARKPAKNAFAADPDLLPNSGRLDRKSDAQLSADEEDELLIPAAPIKKPAKKVPSFSDLAEDLTVSGSPVQLRQLLSILLDNAVKYCPEGGRLELSLRREDKAVLRVKNSVTEKVPDPERFFDRFFRADESRSRETGGNGIGLSAAQAIAQGHKGSIHAAYEGDAIVFTLALPLD